ncbi:MAG: carbohydrate-binding protein [Saprospiraceae bacterium]
MKNLYFLLSILFILFSNQTNAQGYLRAQDKNIVNENGETVILRGMGLGGWMLQEGYMLQTASFANAQYKIRNSIEDLIGEADTDLFYEAWLANHVRKADIDSLKAWGFNSVRLPMHYNLYTLPIEDEPIAGEHTWLTKGFELTDSLISWCKQNEMYVILDLHAAPGGQGRDEGISDYDTSKPSLWESEANQAKTVALWKRLAERYVEEPWIGGYDLINETNWEMNGNGPLRKIYEELTTAIREVDTKHIIFIEGNWFANDFTGLTPPWADNLVYSPHKYWSINDQASIQWVLDLQEQHNVPLYFGEWGENSNPWFRDAIDLFESNGIGWAVWPMKKIESIAGPLSIIKTPDYQTLLDYWNGNGTKPTAVFAKAALMGITEGLKIENCIYQKDVIDAMFRQQTSMETIPFNTQQIPGVVYATDYDMGVVGEAYFDVDIADFRVSTGNFTAWNSGWTYRNDGVDIEKTEDKVNTNGYNVGWTSNDEWMQYDVNVAESGVYSANVRVASGGDGGQFHFAIGEGAISPVVNVSGTDGWQNWETVTASNIVLTPADKKIRFYVDESGFNVNSFEFTKVSESTIIPTQFVAATTLDDQTIRLSLNKRLGDLVNANSDFQIFVNNSLASISNVVLDAINPRVVTFTVNQTFRSEDVITISYTGNQIKAEDGTDLNGFTKKPVQNKVAIIHSIPGRVEAEDYVAQSGIQLENTTDTGGGQNIGYLDADDYLDYFINVAAEGIYEVNFRTAVESQMGQVELQLIDENGTAISLENLTFPATGGWQTWATTTASVNLPAGQLQLRVLIKQPLFNINWFEFTFLSAPPGIQYLPVPGKIEAEAYETQVGVELENTTDTGGGQNIDYLDADDYLDYFINVAQAGIYQVDFRTAAESEMGQIELQLIDDGGNATVLDNLTFPATGGWQIWTNTTASISLPAGQLQLRIVIKEPLFNINWFEFSFLTSTNDILAITDFQLFPNPAQAVFFVKGSLEAKQNISLHLVNILGQTVLTKDLGETQQIQETVDLSGVPNGSYMLVLESENGERIGYKILKNKE